MNKHHEKKVLMIHKGMRIKVDFNKHRFLGPNPDIQYAFIQADDQPRNLYDLSYVLVGRTKKEYHTVGTDAIITDHQQLTFFSNLYGSLK